MVFKQIEIIDLLEVLTSSNRVAAVTNATGDIGTILPNIEERMHVDTIKTIRDFEHRDKQLEDQKEYDRYKYILSRIGGVDYKNA